MSTGDEYTVASSNVAEAQRVWTTAVDNYCGASELMVRVRREARKRGEKLPEWLAGLMDDHVSEAYDKQVSLHAEYEAALTARKDLAARMNGGAK